MKASIQNLLAMCFLLLSFSANAEPWPFEVKVEGKAELPKMILIPGLASSAAVWDSTKAHYQGKYQTHVMNLKGFAGVPMTRPTDLMAVRDAIIRYLKVNKLDKPVIVGHSLGGFLGLSIAIDAPAIASKLIIVDSLPFLPAAQNPMATVETVKPYANQMKQQTLNGMSEQQMRLTLSALVRSPEQLETVLKWSQASAPAMVAQSTYQLMTTDLRQAIKAIEIETLVLGSWAAYARFGATEQSTLGVFERQYSELKSKRIVMAPQAYHFIMLDSPEWMLAQTDKFLF